MHIKAYLNWKQMGVLRNAVMPYSSCKNGWPEI